jgi:hypothetical protein
MNQGEIIARMRAHVDSAEEMLAAATADGRLTELSITATAQSMILQAALVHATLACFYQGEL